MKQMRWIYKSVVVLFPLSAVIAGCSGSGGGVTNPTPTPTATVQPIQNVNVPVNFGNGQNGTLVLRQENAQVSGTISVAAPTALIGKQAFSFRIAPGTYPFSGTFSLPRSFNATGNFPAPIGQFRLTGTLPQSNQAGSFTLSAAGQTVNGALPAPTPAPTATPIVTGTPGATATPTTRPGGNGIDIGFSNGASSNANLSAFRQTSISGGLRNNATSGQNFVNVLVLDDSSSQLQRQLSFNITTAQAAPLRVGQTFSLASSATVNLFYTEEFATGSRSWRASGGSLQITAIGANSITVALTNAQMQPVTATNAARGSFTLSGSIAANGLIVR